MHPLQPQDIAVGIPIYKKELSPHEIQVLQQGQKILGHYPLYFIAPPSIDRDYYLQWMPQAQFVIFEQSYFENVKSYSLLMTQASFYQAFEQHEYLLIYQTDAYVFRDELLEWANKGYDYIGAPWIEVPPSNKKTLFNLSKWLYNKVGNGGFCLRKISTHIQLCQKWGWIQKLWQKNEDFFWCVLIPPLAPSFQVPPVEEALAFAFELAPATAYQRNGQQLPFGCHAWEKYQPEFWGQFIKGAE